MDITEEYIQTKIYKFSQFVEHELAPYSFNSDRIIVSVNFIKIFNTHMILNFLDILAKDKSIDDIIDYMCDEFQLDYTAIPNDTIEKMRQYSILLKYIVENYKK
jgi:hypothetical protein